MGGKTAAVLEMHLGGQGVGEACDRILYGEVNPSGRLAETFPLRLEDSPCYLYYPGDGKKAVYGEEIFVGYRYYDTKKIPVRWAFGHGKSYTTFEYSNLKLDRRKMQDGERMIVTADITNIGERDGKEVVQLYISDKNKTPLRPEKELKGFQKIQLKAGETKTVSFEIVEKDLSYYEEMIHDWYAPSGIYQIRIGHASDEILLEEEFEFVGKQMLPMRVDGTTTVGDLLKDPRTAEAAYKLFGNVMAQNEETAENSEGEADAEMLKAILEGAPLKSLVSLGAMTGEEQEQVIATLNRAMGSEQREEK